MNRKSFLSSLFSFLLILTLITLPTYSSPTQASADITDTGTWTNLADMAFSPDRPSGILLQNGKVLMMGCGWTNNGNGEHFCSQIYNPKYNNWKISESLIKFEFPYANGTKKPYTTTMLNNGKILVVGYGDRVHNETGMWINSYSELYDPINNKWTLASNEGDDEGERLGSTATLLPNGKVIVVGGFGFHGTFYSIIYNPTTNSWGDKYWVESHRNYHTATLLQDGNVLTTGGSDNGLEEVGNLSSAELYDYKTSIWTKTTSMSAARAGHTATLLSNGKVLVAGGVTYDENSIHGNKLSLSSVELFDPISKTWSSMGNLNTGRFNHTATLLPDGRVLVIGGTKIESYYSHDLYGPVYNDMLIPLNSSEIYNPNTDTWTILNNNMNSPHTEHVAALMPDRRIFIAGGDSGYYDESENYINFPASAEIFNPDGIPPTFSPPPAPEACSVTSSPNTQTLSAGDTTTISAEVTSGLGDATIDRMYFGSYDTDLATVDPEEDTDSPYETTITAIAEGETAIGVTAELSDGRTCESSEDTDTDVSVAASPVSISNPPPSFTQPQIVSSNVPQGEAENLIVLVHGCCTDEADIPRWNDYRNAIEQEIEDNNTPGDWEVVVWDWRGKDNIQTPKHDYTVANGANAIIYGIPDALTAYNNAFNQGIILGHRIANYPSYKYVHFIGHSAGSNLINSAIIRMKRIHNTAVIHTTFLDAFTPYSSDKINYGKELGNNDIGEQYVNLGDLPKTESTLSNAYNFDVTNLVSPKRTGFEGHQWPVLWYKQSIQLLNYTFGFPVSFEEYNEGGYFGNLFPGLSGSLSAHYVNRKYFFSIFDIPRGKLCSLIDNHSLICSSKSGLVSIPVTKYTKIVSSWITNIHKSATGTSEAISDNAVGLTATLYTGSPVWFEATLTTPQAANILKFDYEFQSIAGANGVLTVFVDDNPVFKIEENYTDPGSNITQDISIDDLAPGEHKIGFRVDPSTDVQSIVKVSNIQLGVISQIELLPPTTTAKLSPTANANGWNNTDAKVTLNAVSNSDGSEVKQITYSATGAQTIANTIINDSSASIDITKEGETTISFFATDNFSNKELLKTITVKIDQVAPELIMQFNPETKKLQGSGEDSLSGIGSVNQTATALTVTDKAGNTSQFTFTSKTVTMAKVNTQTITINSLKYNSDAITIPKTILIAAWTVDSSSAIKYLLQTFNITKQEGIVALYNAAKSKTTSLEITKGSDVTKSSKTGLVLIKMKSNNGKLFLEL